MSINKNQRRKLKALAHHLKKNIIIGKDGVTEGAINSISEKIEKDELIKIKFSQHKEKKRTMSNKIVESIQAEEICLIGNILTIYKKSKNPQNRHIKI